MNTIFDFILNYWPFIVFIPALILFFVYYTKFKMCVYDYKRLEHMSRVESEKLHSNLRIKQDLTEHQSAELRDYAKTNLSLHNKLQTANINLINARGSILKSKNHEKVVSHGTFKVGTPDIRWAYNHFKGWRVVSKGFMGYVAGCVPEQSLIILGFYEYTGNNNVAINDECIMSTRQYVDYESVTIDQLRSLGFV